MTPKNTVPLSSLSLCVHWKLHYHYSISHLPFLLLDEYSLATFVCAVSILTIVHPCLTSWRRWDFWDFSCCPFPSCKCSCFRVQKCHCDYWGGLACKPYMDQSMLFSAFTIEDHSDNNMSHILGFFLVESSLSFCSIMCPFVKTVGVAQQHNISFERIPNWKVLWLIFLCAQLDQIQRKSFHDACNKGYLQAFAVGFREN